LETNRRGGARPRKANWKHFYELEAKLKEVIDGVNYSVSAVIVEGKRDEEALRSAGLRSTVVQFSCSGLPLFAFVEELVAEYKGRSVLVLLDFDSEGDGLAVVVETENAFLIVERLGDQLRLADVLTVPHGSDRRELQDLRRIGEHVE